MCSESPSQFLEGDDSFVDIFLKIEKTKSLVTRLEKEIEKLQRSMPGLPGDAFTACEQTWRAKQEEAKELRAKMKKFEERRARLFEEQLPNNQAHRSQWRKFQVDGGAARMRWEEAEAAEKANREERTDTGIGQEYFRRFGQQETRWRWYEEQTCRRHYEQEGGRPKTTRGDWTEPEGVKFWPRYADNEQHRNPSSSPPLFPTRTIPSPADTKAKAETWKARVIEDFANGHANIQTFPVPPSWRCMNASCRINEDKRTLKACSCNITMVMTDLYGHPLAGESALKKEKIFWHPDRFSAVREDSREIFQRMAQEIFVVVDAMLMRAH